MERITHKLKEFNSKLDVNKGFFIKPSFFGEQMLLPLGEINHIVNVGEVFNTERNQSKIYRLKGTITPLFSNPLMNLDMTLPDGTPSQVNSGVGGNFGASTITTFGNGLNIFNGDIFRRDPYNNDFVGTPDLSFEKSFLTKLVEVDGWFGFSHPDITKPGSCSYYDIEPSRERFELDSYGKKNWEITITYPYSSDTTHITVQGGLLIIGTEEVEVGGVPMVALATSTYHGLSNGDKVILSGMSSTNYNGEFTVKRVGLDNGDYKSNYFVININPATVSIGTGVSGRMKRIVSGYASEYYVRIFKKLLEVDGDYEMYPLGFSNNVFNDQNYQFIINEDIDITDRKDNLGRPLSELYLTKVKVSDKMFHNIQSGFDLEFLPGNLINDVSNSRQITYDSNTSQTPLDVNVLISDVEFYGDIVEYNKITLRETILSDVLHRFNTVNREVNPTNSLSKGPRREGYLYNPHDLIKIREFSLYNEQGDDKTLGIPDYAENLGDGRWLWRDLLDIGIFDGEGDLLDYPFTNGVHYIHQNYCFKTLRQDPFSRYNLYHRGSGPNTIPFDPPDPIGDSIGDNFVVKRADNVC